MMPREVLERFTSELRNGEPAAWLVVLLAGLFIGSMLAKVIMG